MDAPISRNGELDLFCRRGKVESRILNGFDRPLEVLHLNTAEICRRSLALVTGLMSQQSINPEFANVAVLVSQKRRDRMAEPVIPP